MTDVAAEAEGLLNDFSKRIDFLKTSFEVELTALAWKLAAEIVAKEMPAAIAVGTLSYKGREEKKTFYVDVGKLPPKKAKGFLKDVKREYTSKVRIKGPQPSGKAAQFRDLLDKGTGKWARRDGKVQYHVMEPSAALSYDGLPTFYKMKRTDNGEIMRVKFSSMVSNWMHIP